MVDEPMGLHSEEKEDVNLGMPGGQEDEEFSFDGTDIEGIDLIPEGKHPAIVCDFEQATSKAGNPQYVWNFEVIAGEAKGMRVRDWTSLLPQARWKVADYLEKIGIPAQGSMAKFKKSDLIGKPCIIEVYHDEWNDRDQHNVQDIFEADEDTKAAAKQYNADDDVPF